MYQDIITLFNFSESDKEYLWYPTTISSVHLQIGVAARLRQMGPESADDARLHIRYKKCSDQALIENILETLEEKTRICSKPCIQPKEWARLKDKACALTFTEKKDFFYYGKWKESPVLDSSYGKKGFYDYMRKNEDGVFLITSVKKCNLIPHFEIGGK